MTAVAENISQSVTDDALARRNAMVLAVAQALAGGNNVVLVATAGIVGAMLAPDKALATVPISVYVRRHVDGHAAGRRAGAPLRPADGVPGRHRCRRARPG